MNVSRSMSYAMMAMHYIAENQETGIVLSQNIAKQYNIPLEYLLKILQLLVKAGVLRSKRGPRGGFFLAKSAKKITMLDIIEAVEGPVTNKLNLSDHMPRTKFAQKAEQVYNKVTAETVAIFKKTKLIDLM